MPSELYGGHESQNRIAILAVSQYVKNRNNIESWPKYRNTIESSHICQFPPLNTTHTDTHRHTHTHMRNDIMAVGCLLGVGIGKNVTIR